MSSFFFALTAYSVFGIFADHLFQRRDGLVGAGLVAGDVGDLVEIG